MREFDVRQLVSASVGQCFHAQEAFFGHLVVQLGSGHGVCQRHLDCFAVEFLGEIDGLVDRLLGFTRQANDEVAVDLDADLAAIFHEVTGHLDRGALLDVLQDLRVAGFEADDKETRTAVRHGLQFFILAVAARGAGPLEFQGLEFLAQFDGAILADVEGVVVEENLFHLREVAEGLFDFLHDVVHRTRAPGMSGNRLRPHAEGTEGRTAAGSVEGNERVQEKRDIVAFDLQIAVVNVRGEGQRVEFLRVELRTRSIVDDFAILAEAGAKDLLHRLAVRVIGNGVVEFSAHHEINIFAGIQGLVGLDVPVRADESHLKRRVDFLDFA